MPTGGTKHQYFVVTKEADLATPKLHAAMESKKPVAELVVLNFWRVPPWGGTEENHYSVSLEKPCVASIRLVMPDPRIPANTPVPEYEEVAFSYHNIGFSWHSGGKGANEPKTNAESDFL